MPDDTSPKDSQGPAPSTGAATQFPTRRTVPRFAFFADAEVFDLESGTRQITRISELSLKGCYVDTINAFPEGTKVRFRILTDKGSFETLGRVIYVHPGIGMGVAFQDIPAEQCTMLSGWLASLGN